ncbi:MAG: PhzF family phenazine biosynthesis protein [Bacilli bacterium]
MGSLRVYHYNAFSTEKDKDNPAGVVFEADSLTEQQMLDVVKQAGFNETAVRLP